MLKEVRFSLQHDDCWLQETSQVYPTATLVISSVYQLDDEIHVDLMIHAPDPSTIDAATRDWNRDKRIKRVARLYEGKRGTRFHITYDSEHSIYPFIIRRTPVSMGAINIANGTEHYALVGESDEISDLMQFLSKEATLKVESVRNLNGAPEETETPSEGRLVDTLTDKQIEALVLAHAQGYYQWPRVLSASELASRLGLSSSAFLDHLRHGEAKVLDVAVRQIREEDPARFEAIQARLADIKPKPKPKRA